MSFQRTDAAASSLLLIDNDPLMLTAMGAALNMQGHRVVLARNEQMALASIVAGQFDVIVLSIEELASGCGFATKLRGPEIARDVPIIFLVPEISNHWLTQLSAQGGVFCLLKPVDPYELIELVEKSLWLPHIARGRLAHAGSGKASSSGKSSSPSNGSSPPATHLTQQSDWVKLS